MMRYHQIVMHKDDRHILAFLLLEGHFTISVAPMGLCFSGDIYIYRTDMALTGLQSVQKLIDNILVEAYNEEDP